MKPPFLQCDTYELAFDEAADLLIRCSRPVEGASSSSLESIVILTEAEEEAVALEQFLQHSGSNNKCLLHELCGMDEYMIG